LLFFSCCFILFNCANARVELYTSVGISSNGTLSKYNYSLWVTNGHAGLDFNRSFKAKNGMSALVGVSAMDGLNNKSAYAEVEYGKWKLGVTALVIAAIVVKSSGIFFPLFFIPFPCSFSPFKSVTFFYFTNCSINIPTNRIIPL
jgi:hypothetical protein